MAEYILITEYRLAILINNVYIMSREGIWIPTNIPELWLIPTNFSRIYRMMTQQQISNLSAISNSNSNPIEQETGRSRFLKIHNLLN
ncbi:15927_t:CDS:2 [Funneliformis caledonium]|uniref:15927_t:CDS:1 n=1 Tax=Funneliformis caledonium TaxID=1117310 RepID=A0A9N9D3N1_9GLOM|nr:15927_t:CDS:2 [Funneliformis caledonium]